MKYSKIAATGAYSPQHVISNHDLAQRIDTSDEWIQQRTGIRQRHCAAPDETVATMGSQAAQQALERAGLKSTDIDMIIVSTCTSSHHFPATACQVQRLIGAKPGPAFDVSAACCGFMYALATADQFIRNRQVKRALVIGAEVMSRVLDWKERATCVLFGDGAGALILEATDSPGILSVHLGSDGSHQDILYLNNAHMHKDPYLRMQGSAVFKWAVKWLGEVAREALMSNKLNVSDLDWLVPHQANIRIIKSTAKKLGLPLEKVILTLDRHANTSAASLPIALHEGIQSGKIKRQQHLLLEAFGGGLTWGSALVRY